MRRRRRVLLSLLLVFAVGLAGEPATPANRIAAPESVQSGRLFVASFDATACTNKPPTVTWSTPTGCALSGQGTATASYVCIGARGAQATISAVATLGRPPACNGVASTSVFVAGGDRALPCCPKPDIDDGAQPSPVDVMPDTTVYYRPGLASTGRLTLRVAMSTCEVCP